MTTRQLCKDTIVHLLRTKARTLEFVANCVEDGAMDVEEAAKRLDAIDVAIKGKTP